MERWCVLGLCLLAGCSSSTPCSKACKKIASCHGDDPAFECPLSARCTSEEACLARCIDQASCEAITGKDPAAADAYLRCQAQCESEAQTDARSPLDGASGHDGTGIRDGARDISSTDTAAPDGALPGDTALPDSNPPDSLAPPTDSGPAQVLITEFMANPKSVYDADGEWLELFNSGTKGVDINGWVLRDQDSDLHKISAGGPLIVPPGGYLVLGASQDPSKNGGVKVAYAYSAFYLANTADEIVVVDGSGNTIDSFSYSSAAGFVIPEGASLSTKSPTVDKGKPSNWCTETQAWPGSAGDHGTPGADPGC
jgi:hypothetical protein